MKTLFFLLTSFILFFTSQAQEICVVSADYIDGENYIVAWSKPFDPENYDSVFIYRKAGLESVFTKVGSQSMTSLSIFKDLTSNTIDSTKYKISFLDLSGNESALSPWHQASIMDYNSQTLSWTKYMKEGQLDESYITSYECIRDQTGLGAYTSMGVWSPTGSTSWFDQEALGTTNSTYYIEVMFASSCYVSKANINTSRSNIKRQFSNAEAGVTENNSSLVMKISPNPIDSQLKINVDSKLIGAEYSITDASGKSIMNGTILSPEMTFDMSQFAKGTYYLSVESTKMMLTKMFVKN
jgi:hypothetical protein